MTRDVLAKANELDDNIRKWRSAKEELEEARNRCWGNAQEVWARRFWVKIADGSREMQVDISPKSAVAALDAEIKGVSKQLEEMEEEFRGLH